MVKLSIVIPYYETYDLTRDLLTHLLWQLRNDLFVELKNPCIEIILIDDGCNEERFDKFINYIDDGRNIYTKYITIVHQKNMGVAKSRNKGIELAKGKYIAFIDCDDMITMDYVKTLLKAIDTYNTDVINFNWYDMTEHIEYRKPHNPAPWKQIYKKETIQRFREDLPYGREDVDWQKEIDSGKYSITYLDKMIYIYNSNRQGSLFWKSTHEEVK